MVSPAPRLRQCRRPAALARRSPPCRWRRTRRGCRHRAAGRHGRRVRRRPAGSADRTRRCRRAHRRRSAGSGAARQFPQHLRGGVPQRRPDPRREAAARAQQAIAAGVVERCVEILETVIEDRWRPSEQKPWIASRWRLPSSVSASWQAARFPARRPAGRLTQTGRAGSAPRFPAARRTAVNTRVSGSRPRRNAARSATAASISSASPSSCRWRRRIIAGWAVRRARGRRGPAAIGRDARVQGGVERTELGRALQHRGPAWMFARRAVIPFRIGMPGRGHLRIAALRRHLAGRPEAVPPASPWLSSSDSSRAPAIVSVSGAHSHAPSSR